MINLKQAEEFAASWIAAWNSRDLDGVLSHYSEDFEFSSPFIIQVMGENSGTLQGKANVRNYWQTALERFPDLHFEMIEVLTGVKSLTIYYKAVLGKTGAEVFIFGDDGRVCRSMVHYNE